MSDDEDDDEGFEVDDGDGVDIGDFKTQKTTQDDTPNESHDTKYVEIYLDDDGQPEIRDDGDAIWDDSVLRNSLRRVYKEMEDKGVPPNNLVKLLQKYSGPLHMATQDIISWSKLPAPKESPYDQLVTSDVQLLDLCEDPAIFRSARDHVLISVDDNASREQREAADKYNDYVKHLHNEGGLSVADTPNIAPYKSIIRTMLPETKGATNKVVTSQDAEALDPIEVDESNPWHDAVTDAGV